MALEYIFICVLFLADAVWIILKIVNERNDRPSGNTDDDGGMEEDLDPVLDLPPGVVLPSGGPATVYEEEEEMATT